MTRRGVTAILLALTLLFASGAAFEGCEEGRGTTNDGDLAQPEPQPPKVPKVNPDTPPRTPGPVAGDPDPEKHRRYEMRVAAAPATAFFTGGWVAGNKDGKIRETRVQWFRTGETTAGAELGVYANWTEISYKNLAKKNTTGMITVDIWVTNASGQRRHACTNQTLVGTGRPEGTSCYAKA